MADINNQLDKTEKELKDIEQQAIKTESAVKKVTEAEQEAMMRAALSAAQMYVKPDKDIEKKTEQIKEQTKEVDSLGKKVKDLVADNFFTRGLSEELNLNLGRIREYDKLWESLRDVKGSGTKKQLENFERLKELSEEIRKNLQDTINKNPEGYISMLQRRGGSREDALNVLNSAGLNVSTKQEIHPEVKINPQFVIDNNYRENIKKDIESYKFKNDVQSVKEETAALNEKAKALEKINNLEELALALGIKSKKRSTIKGSIQSSLDKDAMPYIAKLKDLGYSKIESIKLFKDLGLDIHSANINTGTSHDDKGEWEKALEDRKLRFKEVVDGLDKDMIKQLLSKSRILEKGYDVKTHLISEGFVRKELIDANTQKQIDEYIKLINKYKDVSNGTISETGLDQLGELLHKIDTGSGWVTNPETFKREIEARKILQEYLKKYDETIQKHFDYSSMINDIMTMISEGKGIDEINKSIDEKHLKKAIEKEEILKSLKQKESSNILLDELKKINPNNFVAEYLKSVIEAYKNGLKTALPKNAAGFLGINDTKFTKALSGGKYDFISGFNDKSKDFENLRLLYGFNNINNKDIKELKKEYPILNNKEAVEKMKNATEQYKEALSNITKQTSDSVKQATKPVEDAVKTVVDNITKQVKQASDTVEKTVQTTVQYVSNTVNGFTLVGGIAEQIKKQFALVPVGKPYVKGDNFNMYDPDVKQLPAVINDSTTALSTEFNNDAIERIKLFYEYLKRIAILKQSLSGNFNYDSGISVPEGAFSNSINDLADNAQQEEVKNTEKAYENLRNKVSEVTNSIKHAIGNVIGVIRTVNNVLHKVVSTIISVFNGAIHTVQRIIQLFGNLGDRIGLTHRQNNLLKGSFTELKSAIDLVAGAFNKIYNNQFIQQGKKLLGSIQTLNMLLGTQLAQSTIEWANNMEKAFGLSAADLISNLREVTAVMYGLGMTSRDVQVGARNLESVGMVLSSISGLQFDVVMSKIQSGMKGMTQAIDDLGLSVRETQMDAYLKKLKAQGGEFANISTSFSKLTEQQRVYVRYAAIMEQFTSKEAYSMENYAKSLRTTTGSLGVLSSQLAGLKSTLGTLALGLFSKVLQPLIYIVYYIRQLIIQLGEFLGIKMKLDANLNGGGTVDTSPVEDETEALDEMSKAASKAKGSLDELDHISTMSSSSGSDAGTGSDFDYSSLLGGYDFADELAKYDADFIEECRQKLIQMLKDAELSISEFIRKQTGRLIDWNELENNLKQIGDNIKATFIGLIQVVGNVVKIIGGLLWSIGDDLDFSSLFEKFTRNIANTVSTINLILERIAPYIQQFYDKYLSKYVIKFGEWLDGKLDVWSKKLHEITMYWIQLTPEQMEGKVDELGTKFENLLTTLKEISIIFKTLFGKDTEADNMFMNENASENMNRLNDIAKTLHETFSGLWDIIKGVFSSLTDLNGDGEHNANDLAIALDWIKEKLDKIKEWVSDNKETITELLTKAAETIGKIAEAKFEVLMKLLNFITEHADLINGVLDAIQKLVDLFVEHPVLTMTAAVGLQVAGKAIKTAMTAALWKEILGIGAGGAGASAGVGGALGTALSSITPVIAITATITALAWELSTLKDQIKEFAKEVDNAFELTYKTAKGEFGTITDSTAHDKYAFLPEYDRNIGIGDIEAWAYDVRAALEKVYGQDITKEQSEKALQAFRYNLAAQGNLTEEQIDNLMEQLETKYDELGKINWYDKFAHGGLFNLWESNGSKENQAGIERLIRQMDELGYSAEDVKNATDGMLDNLQSDVDNTNTSLQSFSDEFDSMNNNVTNNINGITDNFGNLEQSTSSSFDELKEASAQASNRMTVDLSSISSGFEGLGTTISDQCNMAANGLGNLITRFSELFKLNVADKLKEITKLNFSNLKDIGIGEKLSSIVSTESKGLKTKIVKGFRGYANGGMPKTGSIFMANENGDTELVGNFGGYPGVANQGMIIKAMESAMYNAVTQALRANNNNSGQTTIEVCKGGVFVGDQSGIRKLANMLNNTNSTSRTNIANTGFSMS